MNKETKLMKQIRVRASQLGFRLFRNNVGVGWVGTGYPTIDPDTVLLKYARKIRFGLFTGSSDLIGWRPRIITQDMVGTVIAQFCAREVKTPKGYATRNQINFVNAVNDAGGDAKIVSAVEHIE